MHTTSVGSEKEKAALGMLRHRGRERLKAPLVLILSPSRLAVRLRHPAV